MADLMRAIGKMRLRFAFFDADDALRVAVYSLVIPMPHDDQRCRERDECAENNDDGIDMHIV